MEQSKKNSTTAKSKQATSKSKSTKKEADSGIKTESASLPGSSAEPAPVPRLKKQYEESIRSALIKELSLKNIMEAPKLSKITINVGLGEAVANPKLLDSAVKELELISGQKAVKTKARKSIAGFKLREGMPIGSMVTLRGKKMWEFLDRFISIALPRIRDFKGLNDKSFDGRGNYTTGLKEQIIFPEIKYDEVSLFHGMDITFSTTARTDNEGRALLKHLGIPFKK
jgi:large subunit ribosomal protein L5|uniref:Large ribosomal subunit protein uL5 n=2 Tax=Leptospirillum TaxID=179 RepID=A0A2I2MH29_9BACT|nr:MAG: Ribosomal protein L5 [Leptospirillum sp. Group II '5-way CG']